jgi:benzoate membrane transport protein
VLSCAPRFRSQVESSRTDVRSAAAILYGFFGLSVRICYERRVDQGESFMFKASSLSHPTAGFVAVLVGFTSSVAIIFQAALAAGATPAEISSWLLALGCGMAVTCIGLSCFYRMPILTAWSTPGAALLITALSGISMPEAIGAFIFSAILIILSGVTGFFEKIMTRIPRSLASSMLAGILLHFATNIFIAMRQQFLLVFIMFIAYLIGKRLFPRLLILFILLLGILVAYLQGLFHLKHLHISLSTPIFTAPVFSFPVLISIGIPLFIVTMTAQNIPGIALIKSSGYKPSVSPIITWTGITNLLLAPFGGFAFNLAAITAGICLSKEAGNDPLTRYKSAVYAGLFYLLVGLLGATVVTLFHILPNDLILAIAGFALLGILGSSLQTALEDETQRESALITFLVSASGITLIGISAAFWGLAAGILSLFFLSQNSKINFIFNPVFNFLKRSKLNKVISPVKSKKSIVKEKHFAPRLKK